MTLEQSLESQAAAELNVAMQSVATKYGYLLTAKIITQKALVTAENGVQVEELRQVGGLAIVKIPGWVAPTSSMPSANELPNGDLATSDTHP